MSENWKDEKLELLKELLFHLEANELACGGELPDQCLSCGALEIKGFTTHLPDCKAEARRNEVLKQIMELQKERAL